MDRDYHVTYHGKEFRFTPGIGLSGPVWLCLEGGRTIGQMPDLTGESPHDFDRRAKEFVLRQDHAHLDR